MTKEEHAVDSLKKICLAILSSDKNVRFVGVVDNKGKLLVGEYNIYRFFEKSGNNNNNNINASLVKSSTFYSSYVVPAIKIRRKVKANQSQVVHFKLVELGDEVYLAVIPLLMEKRHDNNNIIINNNSNRYLCIYIELENISSKAAVSSSLTTTSYKEIISKIINDSI